MTVRVTPLKGSGAGTYYVAEPGGYYVAAGEPAGRWFGAGAARLGLNGVSFDPAAFVSVLAGMDPSGGVVLGRPFGEGSVRGYDVTFSAPKSVSLLAALGDAAIRAEVHTAHDAAVEAVLDYVQRHALTRFRVDGEVMSVDAEGIVAGVFRQHVSRELDPQLHSHAVIANRVVSPDGRWLALDARTLVKDQTALSALYHAGLRAELTSRLGVAWREVDNGIAEMAGIDREVLEVFSLRSGQVASRLELKLERFRATLGREPTERERWRLEREAVTDSRRGKPGPVDAAELRARWGAQLADLGLTQEALVGEVLGRQLGSAPLVADEGRLAEQVVASLEAKRSTWRIAEVLRELARVTSAGLGADAADLVAQLERDAGALAERSMEELAGPLPDGVAVRSSDGRPAWESPLQRRFTTTRVVEEEERVAQWAHRRWSTPGRAGAVDGQGLDHGQFAAAAAVAGEAELVVVVGPAGTGKTTALRPAIEALHEDGREVLAVAPTATAAAVLRAQTGVAADTIDKLLVEHRRRGGPGRPFQLDAGATLLVDEAAMVATPTLAELARLADRRGWRVVLVGDPQQFLPVGRGGMFDWLVEHGPAIELSRVWRFEEPWERDASLALRAGDSDVLALYEMHGRLHRGEPGDIEFEVIDHWAQLRESGDSVAMLAPSNDTVKRLNDLAQRRRIGSGELDPAGPSARTAVGYRLLVGDEIATRHNDRQLRTDLGEMIRNRDRWTIRAIADDGAVVASGRSGMVAIPAGYVRSHVELGYAQTSHGAQGLNLDHSLLLVDRNVDNRAVYVPLSRGCKSNHAYVALDADDPRTARDVLAEAVNRDWADIPAIVYRAQLEPVVDLSPVPQAVPRPPLRSSELRALAGELRRIDEADVPTWRGLLENDLDNLARRLSDQQHAAAALTAAKAERDRIATELAELSPWNPFHQRQRRQLEIDNRHANVAVANRRQDCAHAGEQLDRAETRAAQRQAWLNQHEPDHHRRPALQAELNGDLNARIERAALDPTPTWTHNSLGARPQDPDLAEVWDHAVGLTSQYRAIHAITSLDSPLGPPPLRSHPDYREWATVAATLDHAAAQLDSDLNPHLAHHLHPEPDTGLGISM